MTPALVAILKYIFVDHTYHSNLCTSRRSAYFVVVLNLLDVEVLMPKGSVGTYVHFM